VSAPPFDSLPIGIERQSSRISVLIMLALAAAALCMVVVPVALLLAFAARDVWHAARSQPVAVAALAAGLLIWAALFLVPARRVIQGGWNRRRVRITSERVSVSDAGLFGSRSWAAPLSEFLGLAHHVRASLSGVRHELILVHRIGGRSVLLHAADSISQPTIDRAAALLRLPQISPRELYHVTRRNSAVPAIDASVEAQAA
jgi:hypothetical protein